MIHTANSRYRPDIFRSDPWVPPPEARPRTVYRVEIRPARIQNEEPATLTIENSTESVL